METNMENFFIIVILGMPRVDTFVGILQIP